MMGGRKRFPSVENLDFGDGFSGGKNKGGDSVMGDGKSGGRGKSVDVGVGRTINKTTRELETTVSGAAGSQAKSHYV